MIQWEDIIAKAVAAVGYVLWGCVRRSSNDGLLLQVMIQKNDVNPAVEIGDCVAAHKQIIACLDVEGVSRDLYRLEVSSPGVERQFFTLSQCASYIGQGVQCTCKQPIMDGRKKIKGILKDIGVGTVTIAEDETVHIIEWDHISNIHLRAEVIK
jgi:ribosome maturation factor RimP